MAWTKAAKARTVLSSRLTRACISMEEGDERGQRLAALFPQRGSGGLSLA